MAGIIYTKSGGTIVLRPKIKGKEFELFTPISIIEAVISGKRAYGHFNPRSDFKVKENKAVKEDALSG